MENGIKYSLSIKRMITINIAVQAEMWCLRPYQTPTERIHQTATL